MRSSAGSRWTIRAASSRSYQSDRARDSDLLADVVNLSHVRHLSRHPALHQLEQDDRLRLVDLQEDGRMHVHADEHHARIVLRPVTGIALLGKIDLPIGRVELMYFLSVAADARDS